MDASEFPLYYTVYQRGQRTAELGDIAKFGESDIPAKQVVCRIAHAMAYETKPPKSDAGRITHEIMREDRCYTISLERLAVAISKGFCILPGICEGKRTPGTWQAQQLWFVDIDNDPAAIERTGAPLCIVDGVERCFQYGLPLVLSYESFSSDPDPMAPDEKHRYRLVFALDEPITDKAKAEQYGRMLLSVFPEADQTCTELNRLFYGTDKEVNLWINPLIL